MKAARLVDKLLKFGANKGISSKSVKNPPVERASHRRQTEAQISQFQQSTKQMKRKTKCN